MAGSLEVMRMSEGSGSMVFDRGGIRSGGEALLVEG